MELTSPEKALEIYTRLRTATELVVRLVRRGQPLALHFEIR
jgi:type II secretory pathway component PulC